MEIDFIPTLAVLAELYRRPRDMKRFQFYLAQMLGENEAGEPDVVLPISNANPMGREHCLAAVEVLQALGAEQVVETTLRQAATAFPEIDRTVRGALTLVDDVGGGWTNRYLNEASERMGRDERALRANRSRHLVVIGIWSSERYDGARLRAESRAALYRYAHLHHYGPPQRLRQVMQMDGAARRFAGERPALPADELDYTREILEPFLDSTDYALQFALLFGDEAARAVGYAPQGVSPYAGFDVALQMALAGEEGFVPPVPTPRPTDS